MASLLAQRNGHRLHHFPIVENLHLVGTAVRFGDPGIVHLVGFGAIRGPKNPVAKIDSVNLGGDFQSGARLPVFLRAVMHVLVVNPEVICPLSLIWWIDHYRGDVGKSALQAAVAARTACDPTLSDGAVMCGLVLRLGADRLGRRGAHC